MKILVTCPYGLSALLAKELKRLQITPLETLETSVLADTDWKGIYTANLWSRLANKCYLVLGEGKVETFNQLFDVVGNLSRGEYLVSGDISVQVVSKHSQLSAERAIQSVSHKAILNALTSSVVVSGGGKHSVVTVVLYLDHDYLKVCLNTSGASLHQRGYRLHTGQAPLKENLTAAMVLLSGWKFTAPLRDPFCGSGTVLVEAAMLARNIAPGMNRSFAFQQFKNYDAVLWNQLLGGAKEQEFSGNYLLLGSDRDSNVLAYAKENALRAGVADCISWEQANFPSSEVGFPGLLGIGDDPSWLLTNPPYGNRLAANEDLSPLYNQLASRLRHQDTFGGVIGSFTGLSQLFLRADFSHKSWYNGADPVVFYYKKPF